jgi:uncharacterized protein
MVAIVQFIVRPESTASVAGKVWMVTAQDDDVEVRKDERTRLYEAVIAGEVVGSLAYETVGGTTALTHSFVDPERRNRGVGSALAEFALKDVAESGTRPLVYCGFVSDYVDAHQRWDGAVDISRWAMIPTQGRPIRATDARSAEEDGPASAQASDQSKS